VRPLSVLVSHFRRRVFEPEDATGDRGITLFHVIGLLAAPGVLLPFVLLVKSLRVSLWNLQRGVLTSIAESDRLFFIVVSMTVTGLVTLLTWDALYPDRKDYLNLLPLPIRARDLFLAKLIALGQFLLGFTLVANVIPGVLAPLLWVDHAGGSLPFRPILAFLLATFAASAFVFFLLAGLQGLLQALLPPAIFRRAGAGLQAIALVAILALLFLRTSAEQVWQDACAHLGDSGAALPPLWFAGLHETLLGRHGYPFDVWAPYALYALGGSALLFVTGYALSYRRFLAGTLDSPSPPPRAGRRGVVLSFVERLFRDPATAGMFRFTLRTLSRGTHHRLVLSAGAALAIALSLSAGLAARSPGGFPDPEHLAVPLIQIFCLAAALRFALARPVELRAAWMVWLAPIADGARLSSGARWAAMLVAVTPPATLAFLTSLAFFGLEVALLQLVFDVIAGLLLVDALVGRLARVPLFSAAVAGEERIHVTALPWVVAFVVFTEGGAALGHALLQRPAALLACAAATLGVRTWARRIFAGNAPRFEGTPDAVPSLGLRPHG
jgi:hypothetical protein